MFLLLLGICVIVHIEAELHFIYYIQSFRAGHHILLKKPRIANPFIVLCEFFKPADFVCLSENAVILVVCDRRAVGDIQRGTFAANGLWVFETIEEAIILVCELLLHGEGRF